MLSVLARQMLFSLTILRCQTFSNITPNEILNRSPKFYSEHAIVCSLLIQVITYSCSKRFGLVLLAPLKPSVTVISDYLLCIQHQGLCKTRVGPASIQYF